MEKSYLKLLAVMLAVMVGTTFVACGDDDDEGGSSSSIPSPVLTDADGNRVQVAGVADYRFYYDESGKLTSFYDGGSTYRLEDNKFAINLSASVGTYYLRFYTNGNGLMSKMEIGCDLKYNDGGWDKQDITFTYQYNSSKQVTRESVSGKADFYEADNTDPADADYGKVKKNRVGDMTFTWTDGNLVAAVGQGEEKGTRDGESFSRTSKSNYTFEYGNQENAFRQFPAFMGEELGSDFFSLFCVVGLFGVGPAYLPTGYTENYTDFDGKSGTQSGDFRFTLNENGTINTEQGSYYYITYRYNNVETRAGSADALGMSKLAAAIERYFEKSHTGKRWMK